MKCAVAIVLAFIGMSLANPIPYGLGGLTYPLIAPPVEARSSYINHGVSIPIVKVPIVKVPIITPIVKPVYPIIKSIVVDGYGYSLH